MSAMKLYGADSGLPKEEEVRSGLRAVGMDGSSRDMPGPELQRRFWDGAMGPISTLLMTWTTKGASELVAPNMDGNTVFQKFPSLATQVVLACAELAKDLKHPSSSGMSIEEALKLKACVRLRFVFYLVAVVTHLMA